MMQIWTDGCCLVNPGGAGGWAFVVRDKGSGRILHQQTGGEEKTTNNRMELRAVVEALRWVRESWSHERLEVMSDSKYVVEGMNSWRHTWKTYGWRKKPKSPKKVANVQLWKQLDQLDVERDNQTRFIWVKGHIGLGLNDLADELACEAAKAVAA
jgi:ribonuclease HI